MDADGPQARLHKGCRWQAIDKWVKPFPRTRWRLATPGGEHSKRIVNQRAACHADSSTPGVTLSLNDGMNAQLYAQVAFSFTQDNTSQRE
ncbi:hypothetical protein GCM10007863_35310 [Dyella mobilis]|nr:hypothetical protein GCM10007863_35310 [Dyella mobilis]